MFSVREHAFHKESHLPPHVVLVVLAGLQPGRDNKRTNRRHIPYMRSSTILKERQVPARCKYTPMQWTISANCIVNNYQAETDKRSSSGWLLFCA